MPSAVSIAARSPPCERMIWIAVLRSGSLWLMAMVIP